MNNEETLQSKINNLDKNKLHILYFDYSAKRYWYNPILLIIKLYYKLKKLPTIDHVCHISRFAVDDAGNTIAKIFEANVKHGMVQNDLFDRLKYFKGKIYIETLNNVDKDICLKFEREFYGRKYSIIRALLSAVDDYQIIDRIFNNNNDNKKYFCSYLVINLLSRLNYDKADQLIKKVGIWEITPPDIYNLKLGEKQILFKQ